MLTGSTQIISPYTLTPDRVKEQQGPTDSPSIDPANQGRRQGSGSSRIESSLPRSGQRNMFEFQNESSNRRSFCNSGSRYQVNSRVRRLPLLAERTFPGLHHRDSWKADLRQRIEDNDTTNQIKIQKRHCQREPHSPRTCSAPFFGIRFCRHGCTDIPCCDRNVDLQGLAANPYEMSARWTLSSAWTL